MLHAKGNQGYQPTPYQLTTPTGQNVERLSELGIFDAQGLSSKDTARLMTKAGLDEIELARAEADRIEAETNVRPQLYGRPIAEVVKATKAAKSNSEFAEEANDRRQRLYASLAEQAVKTAE